MKIKQTTTILTLTALLTSAVPAMPACAAASINIGDYLEMGTYYGEPIMWRCVDIDSNGPLMLTDKIICIKSFDASGDNTSGSHGRLNDDYRKQKGSNYWADSNIRSWLNSNESAGNVTWLCGNPPDEAHVVNGYNDYADEAGFKTNFTAGELSVVMRVTQDSLLNRGEYADMSPYGSTYHEYNDNIANVVQNANTTAYRESVTDDFFLLDVNQVNAVYNNGSILGSYYYIGRPTAKAVAMSEYHSSGLAEGKKWDYWLRSPHAFDGSSGHSVRYVSSDGYVYRGYAIINSFGVRPAFYLDLSSAAFTSGQGTSDSPYRVYGTGGGGTPTAEPVVTAAPNVTIDNSYSGGTKTVETYGVDVNNLLSNITVGNDKIRGPKLSVFGHDFYLFELDGKVSFSLGGVKIEAKFDAEKNTIKLLGGYDYISEKAAMGDDYTSKKEYNKAYNDLKSLYTAISGGTMGG